MSSSLLGPGLAWRYDRARLSRATRTPQGFLQAPAYFTRVGVFEYRRADGSKVRELRPESEVFNKDSLATLSGAPLTKDHPAEGHVDTKNAKALMIGHAGEQVERKDHLVAGRVTVHDSEAIAEVEAGKLSEISMGYVCRIDATPGKDPVHGDYDQVQREIRYNHVALGPPAWGRAGSEVGLRLDSADAVQRDDAATSLDLYVRQQADLQNVTIEDLAKKMGIERWDLEGVLGGWGVPKRAMLAALAKTLELDVQSLIVLCPRVDAEKKTMEKIIIAGIEFEVAPQVAQALKAESARQDAALATVKAENEKLQGRFDAQTAELKTATTKLTEAEKPERFDSAVAARIDLVTKAKKVLGDVEIKGTKREIMETVLKHDAKDLDLTGKSEDYVEARFDALVEKAPASALGESRAAAQAAAGEVRADSKAAQARMAEYNAKAWQLPLTITQKGE